MNIHGTIINRSDVREGDFDAKVEVFASGRAKVISSKLDRK